MPEFDVKPKKLKEHASKYEKIYKVLENSSDTLDSVKSLINGPQYTTVIKDLVQIQEEILLEATKMENLKKALMHIVQEYITAESRLCDEPSDKRSKFQKFLAALRIGSDKYQDSKYYDTTEEQEEAQDQYMKQQIAVILAKQEYSEAAWNAANTEERKAMLSKLMNEVVGIYGVDVDSEITWTNTQPENGVINHGGYHHDSQYIRINVYYMENRSTSYDLTSTIIHELRHAYQHQAVDQPENYAVTDETLGVWESNFNNYVVSRDGLNQYREQQIEIDARDFAGQRK